MKKFLQIIQESTGKLVFKRRKKQTQEVKVNDTGKNVHIRLVNF